MAKITSEELISALKEMTVLELNDLVKAIEEEFGVSAAAPVAVAGAAPVAEAEEEASEVSVFLNAPGQSKVAVIKVVREITGLGLVEAKAVADNGGNVKENIAIEEANEIKAKLEEAGATVELA